MSDVVVADTGPLIGLARSRRLALLHALYGAVWIPPVVYEELQVNSSRPGAAQLQSACRQGWLHVHDLPASAGESLSRVTSILDAGEAEAIVLAETTDCRFLLIDDRRGRSVAKHRGIRVVGTAGILLAAKRHGSINAVVPVLHELAQEGYRLSSGLMHETARLAGESLDK